MVRTVVSGVTNERSYKSSAYLPARTDENRRSLGGGFGAANAAGPLRLRTNGSGNSARGPRFVNASSNLAPSKKRRVPGALLVLDARVDLDGGGHILLRGGGGGFSEVDEVSCPRPAASYPSRSPTVLRPLELAFAAFDPYRL